MYIYMYIYIFFLRERIVKVHVGYGLVSLQIGLLGSIKIKQTNKKPWAGFTLYVLNNFHMRNEPHIRPSMIKGMNWAKGI